MSEKISLVRLKKFGKTFEIRVDPEAALAYKKGEISELDDVLLAEKIFTDAHKGYVASQEELNKVFNTIDFSEIADNIVKHGEIQLTSEHRSAEREKRHRRLIEMIHKQDCPIPHNALKQRLNKARFILMTIGRGKNNLRRSFPDYVLLFLLKLSRSK